MTPRRPRQHAAAPPQLGVAAGAAVAALGVTLSATALVSGVRLDLLDASEVVRAPAAQPVADAPDKRIAHERQYHLDYVLPPPEIRVQLTGQPIGIRLGTVTPIVTPGPLPFQMDLFA